MTRSTPIEQFRRGVELGDPERMLGALAPGAFLRSPVAGGLRFEGREQLARLFGVTTAVYEHIDIVHDFGDGASWVLGFRARIGKQPFEETLVLGLAVHGLVEELTASIRPMAGVAVVGSAVGKGLARQHGRARSFAFGAFIAPLVGMARSGDGLGPRLLGPLGDVDR